MSSILLKNIHKLHFSEINKRIEKEIYEHKVRRILRLIIENQKVNYNGIKK